MAKRKKKTNIKTRKVVFSSHAPGAKRVVVPGDFNEWRITKHPMKKNENGDWEKIAMLPAGRYGYRFLVDGQWWNDPKNDQACPNCFGTHNNVLEVPAK